MSNILCINEEQKILTDLFEDLKELLQDSDAIDEKEMVKLSLRKMTDTTTYIILGEEGVGKTSLLRAVFQDVVSLADMVEGDLCEYRWGEQELLTPVINGGQKKFVTSDQMRGLSIVDTKGINVVSDGNKIKEMVEKSSAVFVVFDAGNVRSPKLWDVIDGCPEKRMLFFLTKCDLISPQELEKNIEKIKCYMKESDISAPLFPVTATDTQREGIVSMDSVRAYIRENVVGNNPMLSKQMENIAEVKKMVARFEESFLVRKKQYEADAEILKKINISMDDYVANHKEYMKKFTDKLASEISKDIDEYQQEIISKMDPYKIKERFKKREDFEEYLNMVNENYKNMMSDSINRKTMEVIKQCMHDLEIIFEEATGYFNTRESILALNDRFYGSISQSRKQMVVETKDTVAVAGDFYKTLSCAAEELFMQVWNERKKYDNLIGTREFWASWSGRVTGATAGIAGAKITVLAGVKSLADVTLPMYIGSFCLIGIGVILGVTIINQIAKKIFDPRAEAKMVENTQKCIEIFKEEVDDTKKKMIAQVTGQVTSIFEKELNTIDGCFTEFRMAVNIDGKRIPILEERLQEAVELMQKVDRIEGRVFHE